MRFERVTWRQVDAMCNRLAKEIRKSGFRPDYIVGIGRGGWVPARLLSGLLGVESLYSVGVRFYSGAGRKKSKPVITQDFPLGIAGKRILIVDDVADTGRSLWLVHKRLDGAAKLKIATLHLKTGSIVKPDFFAKKTAAWVRRVSSSLLRIWLR